VHSKSIGMIKQLTGLVICSTLLLTSSCDPERNTQGTYYTSLKSSVSNAAPAISLGDTLRFTLLWPDILDTKNGNGETRNEPVTTLQEAWFAYRIFRVDTINNTVYTKTGDSTKVNFFLTEGYENTPCQLCYTGTVFLQRTAKPFRGTLNLVPRVKGLFYIEIIPQMGSFRVNNNFEGRFAVDFDVPDKHAALLAPYLNGWVQLVQQRGIEGFGIYSFRVL
jgi:hypothetical protein